ncbi:hypothetical protein V7075_29010 [Neobacillus drentensis]|uniref:hypothetical protein n=1 Tax=Neobacillus drentensis TaxID=220684 RepID=UPI002FFFEBCC
MEDLTAGKNQTMEIKSKNSIFDSSKFWGQGPLHRKLINESINEVIDEIPITIEDEESKEQPPKKSSNNISSPSNVKHFDTISGNHIISRGWDGNNMWEFKIRRK